MNALFFCLFQEPAVQGRFCLKPGAFPASAKDVAGGGRINSTMSLGQNTYRETGKME